MQQLKQQSPLDKGDPNNAESLCFFKLMSRNTVLSVVVSSICISDICQFPDPCNVHANRSDGAHEPIAAIQLFQLHSPQASDTAVCVTASLHYLLNSVSQCSQMSGLLAILQV